MPVQQTHQDQTAAIYSVTCDRCHSSWFQLRGLSGLERFLKQRGWHVIGASITDPKAIFHCPACKASECRMSFICVGAEWKYAGCSCTWGLPAETSTEEVAPDVIA